MSLITHLLCSFVTVLCATSVFANAGHDARTFERHSQQLILQLSQQLAETEYLASIHNRDDVVALGRQVLDIELDLAVEMLSRSVEPPFLGRARDAVVKFVAGFNPFEVGQNILSAATRYGPAIGLAVAISEVGELSSLALAIQHPQWWILSPLYVLHLPDIFLIGSSFKVKQMF